MKKILKKTFITLLVLGFLSPFIILGYYLVSYDYDISSLVNYKPKQTSRIYDKHGEKIANIFDKQHRYYASFNEIPPRIVEALVAIEDTTFFEHSGVNFDAIFRAIIKDIKARKMVEGASTITQQLVKNKLLTREKKLSRKIKELIYSYKLENALTKEQILERYLNEIYFGHGYYGVKTAADGYFHKKLSDLTLKEMAILVGLPKAPSTYAPTKNYDISMGRANRVITRMHTLGWIDDAAFEKALAETPVVYDDTLTQNKAPFIVDEVARRFREMGLNDLKTGGYEIYTTIDLKLQDVARQSLQYAYTSALKRIKKYKEKDEKKLQKALANADEEFKVQDVNVSQLNGALVSLDSKSGDILALVGSVDYKQSSYNRATQGRRQPGSAFKPFIYQVAIDLGYSGATKLVDIAQTYEYEKNGQEMKWQPRNYEKNYKGLITLREALIHSRNLATINLVNDIGLSQLLKELKRFHFKSLPNDLSISLGTMSMSPLELAQYYTSFSNYGIQVKPHLIASIDQGGSTIYEKQDISYYITAPTQAFIMTTILRDVVRRGTGRRARVRGIELAGKTGTTNNNIDAWFAGYSPTVETVVWFGNDDNTPMYHKETGGRVSGPAFAYYFRNVLKLYPQIKRKFDVPEGIIEVDINGKKEYFSDISKPPRREQEVDPEAELLF
ncbi:penicillin-binding protein 1A [Sulfurimonas autotrophica]|uniref:Penicillin-binding protein, 1A family n=1 Tax=Sulfurimonas autotrophica (strain ATCC BAA-671 / DSM 16294 / JCM 11897 / OK10) TaxID=563040 RepID=E0UQQ2_SULAO|nr:PBP1A family penicillin-binding protein [Sulfurimonas autotrophica]ADN09924.1 penicillin-binding protein, 1A family [Sulfurimonas autotrophica DSM 16294]